MTTDENNAEVIRLLEKKLQREKKAKELAEQQLEEYSREIYLTNETLKESLLQARKKQRELAFLREASAIVTSEISIGELLAHSVELAGDFFNASCGLYFHTSEKGGVPEQKNKIWWRNKGWIVNENLTKEVMNILPSDKAPDVEHWVLVQLEDIERAALAGFDWLIFVNFRLLDERSVWLVLLSNEDNVDEESLYVLDTARDSLVSGIRRRLGEIQVRHQNKQLQNTISELENTRQQLVQSEKMASLGQLAAGITHEINNPVGFIRSNTEVLAEYLEDITGLFEKLGQSIGEKGSLDDVAFKSLCDEIDMTFISEDIQSILKANLDGIDRVGDIVESLKTFSHAGSREFTNVSLYDCIENALKVTANALKYEYKVHNSLQADIPQIKGDTGQLQQVFINMLINATHAMPDGGDIYIYSECDEKSVKIFLKDTGVGMDEKTVAQLFTPFFTTKPVGVGTGLGLSVSYAIIEAHQAKIKVDSEPGKGTCFEITFPALARDFQMQF